MIFKIKHKLYTASVRTPLPPTKKNFLVCNRLHPVFILKIPEAGTLNSTYIPSFNFYWQTPVKKKEISKLGSFE